MDEHDLEDIRERLAEWDGFVASATGEQWDDWGRREMGIAILDLGTLLAETVRLRALNADLLAACELALPHLVNEPAADAVRAAIAQAKGVTDDAED